MAYSLPTWTAGAVITAADLTKVNDSIGYLLTPNTINVRQTTSTFTTTATSATNVDAAYSSTIATHGGHILIYAGGYVSITGAGAYTVTVGLSLDGSFTALFSVATLRYFDIPYLWVAPSAATHTVALQWYVSSASGTATLDKAASPLYLYAIEL